MFQSPLDAALRYAERGWFVFPCKPDKKPLTDHGFQDATTDAATIVGWWRQWPQAQIGVDCGRSGLVVVDLDLGKGKDGIASFSRLEEDYGPHWCGLIATTPRGGRHYVYRAPDQPITCSVDVIPGTGIDVRGKGGYIVVPSPASPGRDWSIGDPFDVDDLMAMPEWVETLMRGGRRATESAPGADGVAVPISEHTERQIRAALEHVNPHERDEWIRVGMALKSTGAREQAYAIWCDWSQKSSKFDARTQRRQWDSLREYRLNGSEITLGTLFHMAREGGYVGEVQEVFDPPPDEEIAPAPVAKPFPLELMNCPGLVGDVAEWMLSQSIRRQPALCLASSIALMSAVLGRRIASPTDSRTNIYTIGIGETGCGKDPSVRLPYAILARAQMLQFFGPGEWKSDSGLRAALIDQPSHVCYMDEFVKQLEAMSGKQVAPHVKGIKSQILQAFQSSSSVMPAAAYANRAENKPVTIEQPNLSMYGTGVPGELFACLDRGAVLDGFLNRFLVFFSDDPMPVRHSVRRTDPPAHLIARLQAVERMTRLGELADSSEAKVQPRVIEWTPAAEKLLTDTEVATDQLVRDLRAKGDPLADMWVRYGQMSQKLALIRVGADDPLRQIDVDDMAWGLDIVRWCTERMIVEAEARVADSAQEGTVKRVLRLIAEAGSAGMSKNTLTRKTQWLRGSERKDVLSTLVESGQVVIEQSETSGRPTTRYRRA